MTHLEKLALNVRTEMEDFLMNATPYRAETATLANGLLQRLVQETSSDVFNMSKDDFRKRTLVEFSVDDERAHDVAKYLFVHAQDVLDKERLAPFYQKAEELLQNMEM